MTVLAARSSDYCIPKQLFHTYPTDALPAALSANVEELRRANPDWQYRLYDDAAVSRFIADHYGSRVLRLFDRISPHYGAARADLFRYLLIYRCGGVYLDVKSRFTAPIASALDPGDAYILSHWRRDAAGPERGWGLHADLADIPGGEFQQWHVIGAAGHPFLHAVIERVLEGIERYRIWRDETGWLGVLRLTGPIPYTRAIAPLVGRYPCRIVPDERAVGLEYSILTGSTHKALFRRHYTDNVMPVVRRPAPLGMVDRAYAALRARKREWAHRHG